MAAFSQLPQGSTQQNRRPYRASIDEVRKHGGTAKAPLAGKRMKTRRVGFEQVSPFERAFEIVFPAFMLQNSNQHGISLPGLGSYTPGPGHCGAAILALLVWAGQRRR